MKAAAWGDTEYQLKMGAITDREDGRIGGVASGGVDEVSILYWSPGTRTDRIGDLGPEKVSSRGRLGKEAVELCFGIVFPRIHVGARW